MVMAHLPEWGGPSCQDCSSLRLYRAMVQDFFPFSLFVPLLVTVLEILAFKIKFVTR